METGSESCPRESPLMSGNFIQQVSTFFPFLVGLMLILARSWKVCRRTCLTSGSLAICMATMYLVPSSTASGVENWLQT